MLRTRHRPPLAFGSGGVRRSAFRRFWPPPTESGPGGIRRLARLPRGHLPPIPARHLPQVLFPVGIKLLAPAIKHADLIPSGTHFTEPQLTGSRPALTVLAYAAFRTEARLVFGIARQPPAARTPRHVYWRRSWSRDELGSHDSSSSSYPPHLIRRTSEHGFKRWGGARRCQLRGLLASKRRAR